MLEEEREQCVDAGHSKMDSGLVISMNECINSFLISTSKDPILSPDLQDLATTLSSQKSISYRCLRVIWLSASPSGRPTLRCLFSGSEFVLQRPKPREKSEELKDRLKKLGEMSEEKAYKELVKDILPKDDPSEPFSSYKNQLGFGLHVVLMMFTGYLVGFTAFRALFNHSAVMNAAGGILGLVCSMLLETTLFIIRSSPTPSSSFSSSTHHPLSKTKKYQ